MIFNKKMLACAVFASSTMAITACGGGGSDSSNLTDDGSTSGDMGTFSLAVTDAPVDGASEVVVQFKGVAIQPADGEVIEFVFDEPRSIDLLALQGTASASLVDDEEIPAGAYEWIRLDVNAEDGVMDSYITLLNGSSELRIPSGSQTGLKLVSGFNVAAGGTANFTIDFDLRKSVVITPGPRGGAMLKPALRLVDNNQVGSIAGTVEETLLVQHCENITTDEGAVYIYSGADVTPTDVSGSETDPLISALVNLDEAGNFSYEAGFLTEGSYTIAYTCDASIDEPEALNDLTFVGTTTVEVTADTQTTHDFVVGEEATQEETATGEEATAG